MSAWNPSGQAGPVTVAVAHRNPLVQAGLTACLATETDFHVDVFDHLDQVSVAEADVLVADYETALALFGCPAWQTARLGYRRPRVMVISHRDRETEIRHALDLGAQGYLHLDCAIDEMIFSVRALHRGQLHLDRAAAIRVAESLNRQVLTARESDVLGLIAEGHVNKTIATRLGITVGTVKAHVKGILAKLGARTRTEAAAIAQRRGMFGHAA